MKKFKKLLLLVLCSTLITGCVKIKNTTEIKGDKSMVIGMEMLTKMMEGEDVTTTTNEEELKEYKDLGFNVEEVTVDGFTGIKLTREYKSIDDVSADNVDKVDFYALFTKEGKDAKVFKVEKGFLKNKYTAKISFDPNSMSSDTEVELDDEVITDEEVNGEDIVTPTAAEVGAAAPTTLEGTDGAIVGNENEEDPVEGGDEVIVGNKEEDLEMDEIEDMDDIFGGLEDAMTGLEYTYTVTLPVKPISNDATKVDGNTLTWNFIADNVSMDDAEKVVEANYVFEMYNMNNIIILGGAALVVIIIIIVIIVAAGKKKKKNAEIAESSEPIHTDFDPSIANQVNTPAPVEAAPAVETPAPVVEQTPTEAAPEPAPVVEAPVAPEAPVVETAPMVEEAPQVMENHEFNTPEAETVTVEAPVETAPVFVDNTPAPAPEVQEVPAAPAVQIEEPQVENVNQNSGM